MHFAVAALCLLAASPPKAAPGKLSPAKEQKIRDLLRETGADKVGDNMLAQMRAQLPPAQYESIAQVIHPNELIDLLVPVYARHFDEEELDGLLGFYRSPLGQKLLGEMPAISAESMAVGQTYAREKAQQLQRARGDVPPADKK